MSKGMIIPKCIKGIEPGKPGAKNARKLFKREAAKKARKGVAK